jgi:thiol-disulfide isomerase/thioredoxin
MRFSARRIGRLVAGPAALACLFSFMSALSADDAPKPGGPPAPAAAPAEGTPPEEGTADPFALPATDDAEAVGLFIQGMVRSFQTRSAEFRSEEGTLTYLNKMDQTLGELQKRKLTADPAVLAASVRMQVLNVLNQIGDPTAAQRTTALVAMLKQSELPELKGLAEQFELTAKVQTLLSQTPAERNAFVSLLAEKLAKGDLSQEIVGVSREAAEILEEQDDPAEAVAAYELFAKALESRKEERLAGLIESLRGAARLAGLVGNPIEIKGTTVEGKPFDISEYKGKVVLVDFWATWCGPCIGELPNVKQNYDLYHAKGFEVVGISLDDDVERLKEFLVQEGIKWPTLFPAEEAQRGWENPLARHYGISGIPTVILVGKDGKVITLDARGPALGEELAKQLGPVDPPAAPADAAPPAAPAPAPQN